MVTKAKIDKWFSRKKIERITVCKVTPGEYYRPHKKWYEYSFCDYCGVPVKFFFEKKKYEQEGGFVFLPTSLIGKGGVQIVAHSKCIKQLVSELEKIKEQDK